jgi:AraC-like DNA-binding protein
MAGREPYIQGHVLLGLKEYVTENGGDFSALLLAAGLPKGNYSRPELIISYRKIGTLLDAAARQLDMPSFGALYIFEMPKHVPFLAPFVMLSKFEKDCRSWLLSVQRYLKIHTNGFTLELIETGGSSTSRLRYHSDALTSLSKHLASSVLAKAVVAAQQATGNDEQYPSRVYFRHNANAIDKKTYERLFHCPVEFNSEHDEIEFEKSVLDLPTHGNLGFFKSVMNFYVRWQISRLEHKYISHATMVSLCISSALGMGQCNIGHVAETLNLTAKKLQRLLADEETSFSEILDNVRKNTAITLLKDSEIPVGNIAAMLDYAGSPPFNLAFRRWTGQSPFEYRKRSSEEAS